MARISKIWTDKSKMYIQNENGEFFTKNIDNQDFRNNTQEQDTDIRPRIKIIKTPLDWSLEAIGLFIVLIQWIILLLTYFKMPNIIPSHINAAGEIDDYGSKSFLFIMPVAATLMYAGITLLQKIPRFYNYANVSITEENAEPMYRMGIRIIVILKIAITLSFTLVLIQTIQETQYILFTVKDWMIDCPMWLFFGIVIYFLIKMQKYKYCKNMGRPKIKIKKTPFDWCVEITGLLILLAYWFIVLSFYFKLPKIIPIHYNLFGAIDGLGSKSTFLMLPAVSTIAYIGITLLQKIPHFYNYATIEITEDNAPRIYQIALRMMSILKLLMVVIFILITMQILQDVFHIFKFMRFWIIWAVLGLVIITMIYSFKKMYAMK